MRELLVAVAIGTPFLVGASVAPERDGHVVWEFEDTRIVESSGLLADDDLVLTVNDSGGSARVFAVDRDTGRTVGETTWSADPEDIEALAQAGPGHVWVGDIGDNALARDSVTVTRVPYGRGSRSVAGEEATLVYPGGAHDAEALLAHPRTGRLYVVTKGVLTGEVYAAPGPGPSGPGSGSGPGLGESRLRKVGTAPGMVTGGAFLDERHVLLRGYRSATVLTVPGFEEVGTFELPRQKQGEGVAVAPDGQVLLSSEGVRSPLLRVQMPRRVRQAMEGGPAPATPERSPEASPAPSTEAPEAGGGPADEAPGPGAETWLWLLGTALGAVALAVLARSVRRR